MPRQVFLAEAGETLHSVGVLDYQAQQGQELRNLDRGITEEVLLSLPSHIPPPPPPPDTSSLASVQNVTLSKCPYPFGPYRFGDQGCSKHLAVIVRWSL